MDKKQMLDILNELKLALEQEQSLDAHRRQTMEALANEISEQINSPEAQMDGVDFVVSRLSDEINKLEVGYPGMTSFVGRLSDILARMGI